jgi:hypothetical protein
MNAKREASPPRPSPPWLGRSAGWGLTLVVALILSAVPAWFLGDRFDGFSLKLDDFVFVARSRTWADLAGNLMRPHNTHVVPLFRLLTFGLIALSGNLGRLLDVIEAASYGVLVLVSLATCLLVARETRSMALGLAAMAGLGLSSVMEPAVTWYAAGQTIWTALAIVLMLVALQSWRRRRSAWRLVLAGLAAASAPLFWSGGYVAGPVGLAYLWADARPRDRLAGLVPMGAVLLTALVVVAVSGRQIAQSGVFRDGSPGQAIRPLNGIVYTAQAIPEILVFQNLGLSVATDAPQGAVLCLALIVLWAGARGFPFRPNSLEAAGAVMAALGFALVYTGRGGMQFDSLRGLGWYAAIPQVGAVLFAAGWCAGRPSPADSAPGSLRPPTRLGLLGVLGFAAILLVLQSPLVEARFVADVHPMSEAEQKIFPEPHLKRLRARVLSSELADRQQRFLARLDGAEQSARSLGASRTAIRRAFGRIIGPGMPDRLIDLDAIDLLALPKTGPELDPAQLQSALNGWLAIEPEARPFWVAPGDPWPPSPNPKPKRKPSPKP